MSEERKPLEPAPVDQPDQWGWIGELAAEPLHQASEVSLELLLRGADWVNRRVETIELIDESRVRQLVSVDFRVPERLPGSFEIAGSPHFALPLLVLPRRSDLACFDVRDESERALPMLTRPENARLSGLMLLGAAERAIARSGAGGSPAALSPDLRTFLAALPMYGLDLTRMLVEEITRREGNFYPDPAVADRLLADQDFRDLLGLFNWASAIHVPLPVDRGERRIVKISWEGHWGATQLPDRPTGFGPFLRRSWNGARGAVAWRAGSRALDLPQLGGAGSHHIQIAAPPGVELAEVRAPNRPPGVMLPDHDGLPEGGEDPDQPRSEKISRRVHLYFPRAHEMRVGQLEVELRTPRHGLLTAALLTGVFVTALLAVYAARAQEIIGQSDTGAAILLLVPALLAGFLVRPGEHAMARVLLRAPRFMTTVLGILPLVAVAGLVAAPGPEARSGLADFFEAPASALPGWLPTLWWVLAGAAALLTLMLYGCYLGRGAGSVED